MCVIASVSGSLLFSATMPRGIAALAKAGLKFSDIQPAYLIPADGRAAFENRKVDAWVTWDPFVASAQRQQHARVLSDGQGLSNYQRYYLASSDYAKSHPQVLNTLFTGTAMSIADAARFLAGVEFTHRERQIAEQVIKEINARLGFLLDVGLDYLALGRAAATLSGGEAQRIRLATQIGSGLVGVLYVLDEPSIGLHQRDNRRLIETLTRLRDLGNTLIVVEHDEDTIRSADWIVDIGPGAGERGGRVV